MLTWLTYFSYSSEHKPHEHATKSFCSFIFDIVFGFNFWKSCRVHDFFYGGRSPVGLKHPEPDFGIDHPIVRFFERVAGRLGADWIFYRKLRDIVEDESLGLLHQLLGELSAIVYYLFVNIIGWVFYQPGWFYQTFRT